jgi:hypothetical protein
MLEQILPLQTEPKYVLLLGPVAGSSPTMSTGTLDAIGRLILPQFAGDNCKTDK